ncbi:adenosine monophosphate-protein transferase SoFic [Clostridium tepidiprofundi DSM 19306]|uniref:Adenosine monophosphate-protein transferase SoFic n=1 Tax=Clostridium tepidiprofundi DSM 19306 TaxID=1121338 RepID=A0A151B4V5_9CLOT|nr:Fic family protein [Clostridium tepidiprofundi]KYH34833.1 adenosine monophosphate-protein transferase SoFic [Clostridium tepidiprofundi DSM 19306]
MKELIDKANERYFTKKELKYRIPREINIDKFWGKLQEERKKTAIYIPLKDQNDNFFYFNITDNIKNNMSIIEDTATRDIFKSMPYDVEISVIADSLIDEAYNSSVIEGAFSTKKRTKELVENDSIPRNKSEQMILNNYYALQYILNNIDNPLNEEIILDIYRILTKNTLNKDEIVDKYRNDFVGVWDRKQNCFSYKAPHHSKVQELMNSLLSFIHNNTDIHPLIKACIIHFYFVYIHPFFDGNGRTARAISYMYLLQEGYDFFRFFSISSMIKDERKKYYEAIENTEIYDSDMTYFVDYYLTMIVKSMKNVIDKFEKEYGKRLIRDILDKVGITLSKRQYKVINFFIAANKNIITIDEYKKKNKISYETARTDLNQLTLLGFFQKTKIGKKYVYKFNKVNEIIKNIQAYYGDFY